MVVELLAKVSKKSLNELSHVMFWYLPDIFKVPLFLSVG